MNIKKIEWNVEKNGILKQNREVCFEEVENAIINDKVLDIIPNHNIEKYPNQKIMIIRIRNYVYYVPFLENDEKYFLKSIIPSRKLNAKYL